MFNCSFSGRTVIQWGFYGLNNWEAAKARRERGERPVMTRIRSSRSMFNAVVARTIRRVGLLMGFACPFGLVFAEPTEDVRRSTCQRLIESLRQNRLKA